MAQGKRQARRPSRGSELEDEMDQLMKWAKVHPFERQYRWIPPRQFKADFAWPAHRLLLEVEGGIYAKAPSHHSIGGIIRDIEKGNLAVLNGWRLLRVTDKDIRSGHALQLVEQALRDSGSPATTAYWKRKFDDAATVIRDRDRYIASLEEQLRLEERGG